MGHSNIKASIRQRQPSDVSRNLMSQIVKNHNKEKEQKIRHQSRKLEKVPSAHATIEYESFTEMDRQKEKELVHP